MSTNLLSRYLQISKREYWQFGDVVPNSFHFYTDPITKIHRKTSCQLLIWFLVWDKFIPLTLLRINQIKNWLLAFPCPTIFSLVHKMKVIENHTTHIARFSQNLVANMLKCYDNRNTYLFVYLFLMPLVMAGCNSKYFLCITFGCPLRRYQAWVGDLGRVTVLRIFQLCTCTPLSTLMSFFLIIL